ncbi:BatA domain-containing protein [Paraflavitalea soli]|uniref:BatA domain-containing protein n=1 Tax=Paraflavitalea soli TaxID=2315862 RepID=UPI0013C40732|nr:BatA domain-containing protein [Paraflavitalea soli]
MLQLLNPIALVAAAAVIIPVLVHLWNVRTGKTLRVGSIALLATSARRRASSLRITNWPLFLLRCFLLLLLAFLLARPVWNNTPTANKQAGWILVPARQLATAHAHYGPRIDSLLAAGLELHDLGTGFEKLQLQDTLQYSTSTPDKSTLLPPWSLLKVLDVQLPKAFPVHVFTDNRLSAYQGDRPHTQLAIHWNSFATGDSMYRSPALQWVTPNGKIRHIEWVSTPAGNYYRESMTGAALTGDIDTSIIRIGIYPGKNMADAQYVKAALQAIAQFTGRRITTTLLSAGQAPATAQNIVFNLDEQQHVGLNLSKSSTTDNLLSYIAPKGTLFQYDTGDAIAGASWAQEGNLITGEGLQHKVYRFTGGAAKGTPLWTLANGQPLLTMTAAEGRRVYHFKSRFNPAWSDMVWEGDFVQTLLPLVLAAPVIPDAVDLRIIDEQQSAIGSRETAIGPVDGREQSAVDLADRQEQGADSLLKDSAKDLSFIIWIAAFILFAAERLLTHRQQQIKQDA